MIRKLFLVTSALLYIFIQVELLLTVSSNASLATTLVVSFSNLLISFLFSICASNLFVCDMMQKKSLAAFEKTLYSLDFLTLSKGETLQKCFDYPQTFMFMYSTIYEVFCRAISLIVFFILCPENLKVLLILPVPVLLIYLLIFLLIRRNESSYFTESEKARQIAKNDAINSFLAYENITGIHAQNYIFNYLYSDYKKSIAASQKFSINKILQKKMFSYSTFIPVLYLFLLKFIFPQLVPNENLIQNLVAIKLFYSLMYTAISSSLEIKMYMQYKKSFDKFILSKTHLPKPRTSAHKTKILISDSLSINIDDYTIPSSGTIQIHGSSGSGKSCLIEYIIGLRKDDDSGTTLYNGKKIAYVGQRSHIFNSSFQENIFSQNNDAIINQVWSAAQQEDVLNSILERKKIQHQISSGQESLVHICRALIFKPDIIILDEFDKNLSTQVINAVMPIIQNNVATVIVITHKADTIVNNAVHWQIKDSRLITLQQ